MHMNYIEIFYLVHQLPHRHNIPFPFSFEIEKLDVFVQLIYKRATTHSCYHLYRMTMSCKIFESITSTRSAPPICNLSIICTTFNFVSSINKHAKVSHNQKRKSLHQTLILAVLEKLFQLGLIL